MPVRIARLACLFLLPGLLAPPALAQAPGKLLPTIPETGQSSAPAPIPITDLADRANQDERFAGQVIGRARGPDPTIGLATRLDAIARSVESKSELLHLDYLASLPVLRLESLERHWKFDARLYNTWRSDLQQAGESYIGDAAELARRRSEWEATHAATTTGLAPAVDQRARAVTQRIMAAEDALSAPLSKGIALGRRGNTVEAEIETGQRTAAAAIDRIDRRMFSRTAPPLWSAASGPAASPAQNLSSVPTGLDIEIAFAREYAGASLRNQQALRILGILLLPLLLWLAFRERRRTREGGGDDPASRVFSRPISSWLLLAMMGVLVLEPDAPLLLHQIAMLIVLVPVLRIIPLDGHRLLGPWPFVASGLYLLLRLALFVSSSPLLYRSYLLFLTVLALGLMLWLLWRFRRRKAGSIGGRLGRFVHAAAWLSVGVLAIAAIANVIGAVALAEMLVGGVIASGYMGLLLYAGVTVFDALVDLLIERRETEQHRFTRPHTQPLLRAIMRLARIAAIIGWIAFTMNRFRLFRPAYASAEAMLTHKFTFGAITLTLGHVAVFVISVFVAFWAARTVRYILQDEVLTRMSLPRGVANSVASLSYYALLLLGMLVALAAAGFEVSQLAFVFGALGVGIGLGLQDVVKNFVSGLILMFERPIQPGDVVDVTGASGRVREIGMRATTIKTFDGADIVVPNGSLLANNLTNWTLRDMNRRVEVKVGVAYGSDPVQVIDLLMDVARDTPGIISEPAPMALFTGFGSSSLDFVVRGWTQDFDNWVVIQSQLMARVHSALKQAGIEIPLPQQDLHLRSVSKEAGEMLAPPARSRPARAAGDDSGPVDDS